MRFSCFTTECWWVWRVSVHTFITEIYPGHFLHREEKLPSAFTDKCTCDQQKGVLFRKLNTQTKACELQKLLGVVYFSLSHFNRSVIYRTWLWLQQKHPCSISLHLSLSLILCLPLRSLFPLFHPAAAVSTNSFPFLQLYFFSCSVCSFLFPSSGTKRRAQHRRGKIKEEKMKRGRDRDREGGVIGKLEENIG